MNASVKKSLRKEKRPSKLGRFRDFSLTGISEGYAFCLTRKHSKLH